MVIRSLGPSALPVLDFIERGNKPAFVYRSICRQMLDVGLHDDLLQLFAQMFDRLRRLRLRLIERLNGKTLGADKRGADGLFPLAVLQSALVDVFKDHLQDDAERARLKVVEDHTWPSICRTSRC